MGVIKRQGIKNTIATYIGFVIGFLNLIVIQPHFLTKEELGLTRILYSFSLLIAMFVPLGIGNATVRFFPQFKDLDKRHHGYFGFMMLFPLFGFVLTVLVIWLFKDLIVSQYIKESPLFTEFFNYVFPMIFFVSFIAILNIYCFSNFKSTIPTYLNDIGVRLLTIAVVSLYYLKFLNLDQFIQAFTGIYGIQLILLVGYIFIFDRPGFKIDWPFFREMKFMKLISFGFLLWFASVASIGLKYFDSVMIGKYMPLGFVGIYTVAAFIPTIIEAPLNAFEKIAASKIAFAWAENNMKEIREIYEKSSLYMFLLGGFLFLNVNINIHDLFSFLPDGYQAGESIVLILSVGTIFNMATGLNAPILFNSDKYKTGAVFLISLAIVVVFMQTVFIPRYGMNGAALATCLASLFYNSLLFGYVLKHFKLQPFDAKNLKVAALIIVLYFIGMILPDLDNKVVNIAYHSFVISVSYLGAVYLLNIIPDFHHLLPWKKSKQ
ncbi:flippase [soil metagenome]